MAKLSAWAKDDSNFDVFKTWHHGHLDSELTSVIGDYHEYREQDILSSNQATSCWMCQKLPKQSVGRCWETPNWKNMGKKGKFSRMPLLMCSNGPGPPSCSANTQLTPQLSSISASGGNMLGDIRRRDHHLRSWNAVVGHESTPERIRNASGPGNRSPVPRVMLSLLRCMLKVWAGHIAMVAHDGSCTWQTTAEALEILLGVWVIVDDLPPHLTMSHWKHKCKK